LSVNEKVIEDTTVDELPKIPLRTMLLRFNFRKFYPDMMLDVLEHYNKTVVRLILLNVRVTTMKNLEVILGAVPNLQELKIADCSFVNTKTAVKVCHPPQLKTLRLYNSSNNVEEFFKVFTACPTLETVEFINFFARYEEISNFLKSLPNLKTLITPSTYCFLPVLPELKIESLSCMSLDFLPKAGTLKELTFYELPVDKKYGSRFQICDGPDIVKHVFEELHLKTLYYRKNPLILNYQPQPFKGCLRLDEEQIDTGLALMKYLKCKFFLSKISMLKNFNV
jgi:hypothetical protein